MTGGFNIINQHPHNSDAYMPISERENPDALSFPRGSMVQNISMCILTIIKNQNAECASLVCKLKAVAQDS